MTIYTVETTLTVLGYYDCADLEIKSTELATLSLDSAFACIAKQASEIATGNAVENALAECYNETDLVVKPVVEIPVTVITNSIKKDGKFTIRDGSSELWDFRIKEWNE